MLPVNALPRHVLMEERLLKLAEYCETFPMNTITWNDRKLGIITSGISYNYAKEVFPDASILKLGMSWPLPKKLIRQFAAGVEQVLVMEELDPFLEDSIKAMGIAVTGKDGFPPAGELNTRIVSERRAGAGLYFHIDPNVDRATAARTRRDDHERCRGQEEAPLGSRRPRFSCAARDSVWLRKTACAIFASGRRARAAAGRVRNSPNTAEPLPDIAAADAPASRSAATMSTGDSSDSVMISW